MDIIERKTSVDIALSGTDFKGAAHVVNNRIERLELEVYVKGYTNEMALENEEQIRELAEEIGRLLSYIDTERNLGVNKVMEG